MLGKGIIMKRICLGLRAFIAAAAFILGPFVSLGAPSAGGLQFDGVDDYVTFGQASSLGGYTFTLETWFKRIGPGVTTTSGSGGVTAVPLVSKGRGEGDGSNVDMNYFLGIRTTDNVLVADFEDAATGLNHPVAGRTAIAMNTWYHAAVTFDRTTTTWRLYLDGVLETQLNVGQIPRGDSIQHASLGSALTSTGLPAGYFAGVLDDVRIWNYARTGAEILANKDSSISSATGLVGSWLLNERTGLTATDSSVSRVDGSLINGPVWANAPAPVPPVTLVPTGATWKYHDQGLNLGTSWREPNFDDSSWSSGPAELGYGDSPATVVSYGPNSKQKYITTYFRHTFTAVNAAAFTDLALRLLRDDGAVVYLNGVEVARQNMPSQTITYTTVASSAVGSTDETTYFPVSIDPANLVEGNNLLAVEIHQNVGSSTDLSFDLELTGQIPRMTLTLQAPAPDALNVPRPPALSANVWHHSGSPMTATIYGRVAPPLAGPNFTIAVLPDTQNYTAGVNGGNLAMLQAQIDFIIANRESSNIVYVAQLGDVSNDGDNYLTQWQNAMTAFYPLGNALPGLPEGIPFGLAVGNHDKLVPSGDTEPTTYYNQYFGIDYYSTKTSYYGGHYGNNNNNHHHLFSASGLDFIVIILSTPLARPMPRFSLGPTTSFRPIPIAGVSLSPITF